jgi:amino acid transporter
MIPKSGGDYAYINEAFGELPAFLYLWVGLLVLVPTGNAITALTFAQYILQPAWPHCDPPYGAVRLLAAVLTCNKQLLKHPYKVEVKYPSNESAQALRYEYNFFFY